MAWSDYYQQKILDAAHNLAVVSWPATVYLGLSSTLGLSAGTGFTEPTIGSNGYARLSLTQASDLSRTAQTVSNIGSKAFTISTGAWLSGASLPYFFVRDASSAGNLLWFGSLAITRSVAASGVTLTIAAGELTSAADTP